MDKELFTLARTHAHTTHTTHTHHTHTTHAHHTHTDTHTHTYTPHTQTHTHIRTYTHTTHTYTQHTHNKHTHTYARTHTPHTQKRTRAHTYTHTFKTSFPVGQESKFLSCVFPSQCYDCRVQNPPTHNFMALKLLSYNFSTFPSMHSYLMNSHRCVHKMNLRLVLETL
jgi:hypothetical protein